MSEKQIQPNQGKDNTDHESILPEISGLVDNQNYLETGQVTPSTKEWTSLYHTEKMSINSNEEYPFGIILKLKYTEHMDPKDDLNTAKVFLGIKNPQKEYKESIEMGLYMGRLFLNDIFDTVNIQKDKLVEGIFLVLTVTPKLHKKSEAVLMALDLTGAVLSKIKTGKLKMSDWSGDISPGAHFKFLRIEEFKSNY